MIASFLSAKASRIGERAQKIAEQEPEAARLRLNRSAWHRDAGEHAARR